MAPELVKNTTKGYDSAIDVWSFGILAVELAEKDPPKISAGSKEVIKNNLRGPPPTISDRWSSEFKDLIAKCLVKDPLKRSNAITLLEHPFFADAPSHLDEFASLVGEYKDI